MVRGIGTSIWGFPKGKAKFVPKARQKEVRRRAEQINLRPSGHRAFRLT